MKKNIFIVTFLVLSCTCFADIQPKKGSFSFGMGHSSTNNIVVNPNTNVAFIDANTQKPLKYSPGFTMMGQYGFADNLSLFFKMIPFNYEDKVSGDKASYSYMHMGLKYKWIEDSFIKVFQDISLVSYSLKNEFLSLTEPIEEADRFVGTTVYLMLDFKEQFLLDVVKPFIATEVFLDSPDSIQDKVIAKVGIFYNFVDKINVMSEYNYTQQTFSLLMQLNF